MVPNNDPNPLTSPQAPVSRLELHRPGSHHSLATAEGELAQPSFVARADVSEGQLLRWSKRLHVQRHVRWFTRLMQMEPTEVGTRLYLRLRKRYLQLTWLSRLSPATDIQSTGDFVEVFGAALKQAIASQFDTKFFFGPSQGQAIAVQIKELFPAATQRTIDLAEAMGKGGIQILGRRIRVVPGELDWQADPVTKRRMWSQSPMDEEDAISVAEADVKYVWEINRHQFLPVLGRALWLTGDTSYARQAVSLIDDWIAQNPVGRGVNWCSHLEVAIRAISWLWTMPYLLAWPELDESFLNRWLKSLAAHHRHLACNLSLFTDPTNHLIGEATALWMLSVCLPKLPGAQEQARRSAEILARELERQVAPDGVNREQASSYHRFVLDFCLQFVILSRRNAQVLPRIVEQRLYRMLEFAAALAGTHGQAPMIGDSDDARGLPMLELVGWDFRDVLSTGGVLFGRQDWMTLAGGIAEVTFWLLGADGIKRYTELATSTHSISSRVFAEGGYCFFRAAAAEGHAELIFDVGPLGLLPNAGHGHADAMSVIVRIRGKDVLTDPGTGTYFSNPGVRDALRRTRAHNTVSVDDLDQADIFGTFKWINPMRATLCESYVSHGFDYARAMHDGYKRLRNPVMHERVVLFVKPWGWIIVDRLSGKGEHLYTRHFNFSPSVRLRAESAHTLAAIDHALGDGIRLAFPDINSHGPSTLRFDKALWSSRYGQWNEAFQVNVEVRAGTPTVLFTFITPIFSSTSPRSEDASTYSIRVVAAKQATLCTRYGVDGYTDLTLVNPLGSEVPLADRTQSNARFLFLRRTADGVIEQAFVAGYGASIVAPGFELQSRRGARFATSCRPFR